MSTTAQLLINAAFEVFNKLGPGRTPGASESGVGLLYLNRMLDGLNIHRGAIFTERIDTWTLTAGTPSYTIGPAGVFNTTRPTRIERANLIMSGDIRRVINLLTAHEWAAKTYLGTEGPPDDLYNDNAYPLATYRLDPTPDAAYQLETFSWQQAAVIPTLATTILVPPGYEEWWIFRLAQRLAAVYGGSLSADAREILRNAQGDVMALNSPTPSLSSDADLRGEGVYNWLIGSSE